MGAEISTLQKKHFEINKNECAIVFKKKVITKLNALIPVKIILLMLLLLSL